MGRSRSDGPSGTKGSECHRSRSGERGRRDRGHGSERRHDSPRHRESGERARATSSSGGSSSRSKQAYSSDVPGSGRASGRAINVWPSTSTHHQHSLSDHHHHGRRESVDKEKSGSSYMSRFDYSCLQSYRRHLRRELSQWSHRLPDQQGWTTRQVIQARQTRQSWLTRQVWWARWTRQMTRTQQKKSQQGFTTWQRVMSLTTAADDSAGVADPAHEEDSTGVADSADRQDLAVEDSARVDGPVAQGTPAGTTPAAAFTPDRQGQDTTMVSDASSLIFLSLSRQINQTALLDFMSIMTLMQRRMDMGIPVPDTQSRPIAQTPTSRVLLAGDWERRFWKPSHLQYHEPPLGTEQQRHPCPLLLGAKPLWHWG